MRTPLRAWSCVVVVLVLAACASPSVTAEPGGQSPHSSPPTSAAASASASALVAGSFDIGDGRTLYLECTGSGSPTILMEAGDQSDLSQWRNVAPVLEDETRVCR